MALPFEVEIRGIDNLSPVFKKVRSQAAVTAKALTKVGQDLSLKLTLPVLAFGAASVKAFVKQRDALDQVQSRLKEVGDTAGVTFKELQKEAEKLQNTSLYGDEEILRDVTTQLLTFTNITGSEFKKTQQAILNIATTTKQDLKSTSIQLAKALNDPIANLGALGRTGIQFTKQQKEQIKAMTEAGNVQGAQNLILKELQKQYGGAAEAAGKSNPYVQLKNRLDDLTEPFGEIIHEMLIPLVGLLGKLIKFVNNLSKPVKTMIVIAAGLAAALGPVLILLGFIISGFGALSTGIGLVAANGPLIIGVLKAIGLAARLAFATPIGIAVSAVVLGALLVIKHWDKVSAFFQSMWEGIVKVFNAGYQKIKPIIDIISSPFKSKSEFSAERVINSSVNLDVAKFSKAANSSQNHVTVDFSNVPKGTNITEVASGNQSSVLTKVGYALPEVGT